MRYKIVNEDDGFYTIKDVPIFKMHNDRGFPCDESWMNEAIQDFQSRKKQGDFRPHILVGHQKANQYEKESVGFLDNLILKGTLLYADLMRIPKRIKERLVLNEFPNRSVEILPKSKRILALALLGGTTPHFSLPQMAYTQGESDEYSLLFRSPVMAFTDEEKKEYSSMVKESMKEILPEVLANFAQEAEGNETAIYNLTSEETSSILESGNIPEVFQAEDGELYSHYDDGSLCKWPGWAKPTLLQYAKKEEEAESTETFQVPAVGYAINPQTREVYQDGHKVGVVVPTAPTDVDALPPIPANADAVAAPAIVKVGKGSEGTTGLEGGETVPVNPNLIPQKRDESEQFATPEKKQLYDLNLKVERFDKANQLLQAGRRAEGLTAYLRDQKAAGSPIGEIDTVVDYLMTQTDEQIVVFKKMLESQPKIALGKIDTSSANALTFNQQEIKQDYELNKEHYAAMGVTETDLKWASHVRTGPAGVRISG